MFRFGAPGPVTVRVLAFEDGTWEVLAFHVGTGPGGQAGRFERRATGDKLVRVIGAAVAEPWVFRAIDALVDGGGS